MKFTFTSLSSLLLASSAAGFNSALFQQVPTAQQTFPSKTDGVEIELPDFDEMFGRAQQVSPLARIAVEGRGLNGARGFEAIEDSCKLEFRKLKARTLQDISKRKSPNLSISILRVA